MFSSEVQCLECTTYLFRYGPVFKTNLVGKDLIVSLDSELNRYVFQQEEKAFQIWYPESFMRILGDDNIITSLGSLHKHIKNLILRVFGPENLRLVLLHDVQKAAHASLNSWLDRPSIELKEAISSVSTCSDLDRLPYIQHICIHACTHQTRSCALILISANN